MPHHPSLVIYEISGGCYSIELEPPDPDSLWYQPQVDPKSFGRGQWPCSGAWAAASAPSCRRSDEREPALFGHLL